ncbi:hypothetical protein BRD00_12115 [Halobacteriales archaeon QS_8_69_26]|nr:MAG: hypothetical protein BRD00_12115 [Halobacteriales archaeon QS_8_69_26]
MATAPTPDESIPEFIVDRFEEHSVETLRTIGDFVQGDAMPSDVPNYVVEALTLQDDETERAIGSYAMDLAQAMESGDLDDAQEEDAGGGDDDDDPPPVPGGGMFG